MKEIKLLLLILAIIMPMMANADPVDINGIFYNLTWKDKTAEVTSNPNRYHGDLIIPEKVTYGNTEYNVTSIGENTFVYCPNLTSVTIPNGVTTIKKYAFRNCRGLTSLTMPNSITSIGNYAFQNCSGLTSVIISNSVTSIGEGAFSGCSSLNSMTIPNSVTSIGWYIFSGCSSLTSVTISNNLTSISFYAFSNCSSLTSLTIPNSVKYIEPYAFNECSSLTSVTIPNSVISISGHAFYGCSDLTSLRVEPGNIRFDSRDNCNAIIITESNSLLYGSKNTIIPDGITSIGSYAFGGISGLTSIIIPNSVTSIGEGAFESCSGLTSVTIPNSVTSIGEKAFSGCSSLTSVAIPNSVFSINSYTFQGCNGMKSVIIPNSVTYISKNAFDCENLTTVVSSIDNPFKIGNDVFSQNTIMNATLYVPMGTSEKYKAVDGWKNFVFISEKEYIPEPEAVTVTVKNCSRVYGETNPTFEYENIGTPLNGIPEISCEATATSPVGTYDILISQGTVTNSAVTYVKGTLTITKAPLTISAGNYTKKQGEDNPKFTLTYDGFKNGDTEASFTTQPTVSCSATKDSPVGDYDVKVSGAVSGNYHISYVDGSLTIEAAPAPKPEPTPEPTPEPMPEPTPEPLPEPQVTTFDEDVDDSSSKEVKVTFVVKESDSSGTLTVAISDDKDASGSVTIPEAVTHNGVEYKVTEIGEGAFQNNTSLTEVKIPASITSIGANAFAGCKNLQEITINIIVPINLAVISARGFTRTTGDDVFEGVNKETCILYVPAGSVDQYKAAPVWKEFKNILPIKSSTGINGVELTDGEPFDVFNLSGQKVKSNATSLEGLPRGIYIVKGKKVIN